ncbi:MAG: hypothetical protein ACK4IY_01800 [Chitinophagales bacterium]
MLPIEETYSWQVESNQAGAEMGKSVCAAGDVNGDGFDDVIVGAHYYSDPEYHEGLALVYYGSAVGVEAAPAWQFAPNSNNASLGVSVSKAGDVNGDGFDDIIVGARTFSGDLSNEGKVFVFHGSADGLSTEPDWTAEGNQNNSDFGGTVSDAGDVNGDGYDDIIIGAIFFDNGQTDEGRAYVYYGSAFGITSMPTILEINMANVTFGSHVSGAGDVNGDGFDDVIVGCRKYTNGENAEGAAFLFEGSSSGLSETYSWLYESNFANAKLGQSVSVAGDVNGDSFDDVIISAHNYSNPESDEGKVWAFYGSPTGLPAFPSWSYESNQINALLGNQVSDAGDVNADGFDDIIVGSREFSNGEISEGRAFVFYGSATGLKADDVWHTEINQASAFFGYSVAGAGDVNNDGADDLIIGAKYWDNSEIDEGGAWVFLGENILIPCTPATAIEALSVTSTSADIFWTPAPGADKYILLLRSAGNVSEYTSVGNSKTIYGLTPNTFYQLIIVSRCGSDFSQRSAPIIFTTLP